MVKINNPNFWAAHENIYSQIVQLRDGQCKVTIKVAPTKGPSFTEKKVIWGGEEGEMSTFGNPITSTCAKLVTVLNQYEYQSKPVTVLSQYEYQYQYQYQY